jgi:3-oxoacyl-(acyl-carrier-protein) synthase
LNRDIVITGVGLRTPMGHRYEDVRDVLAAGRPVIRTVDGPKGQKRALATLDHDISAAFSRVEQLTMDPTAQLAVLTANDAIGDSRIDLDSADRDRIGVYIGCGQGATDTRQDFFTSLALKDTCKKFSVLRGLDNGTVNHVAIRHRLRGECQTIALACSSSNTAIAQAVRAIRHGELDAALAGGVEATFTEGLLRVWEAMGTLAKFDPDAPERCCRPFSASRTGLVLGEGAAMYLLETEASARARGARIYGRVVGLGTSCDATSMATPDASGQSLAMQRCLRDAGIGPRDVRYVNAHGTATIAGDPAEVESLRAIFGPSPDHLMVSATKAIHGHLLGAAGAVELMAVLVALNDGIVAPTANLDDVDPAFEGLDYVPNVARTGVDVPLAISSNFAFGGSNACLALARA